MNSKPVVQTLITESGAKLVRFKTLEDIFYYDVPANNPGGLGNRGYNYSYNEEKLSYFDNRLILTPEKLRIVERAKKELQIDREFLDLVYKAKSDKRKSVMSKFGGNLSMPHYAAQSEKVFKRGNPGAKKITLDMAFQVGTFIGESYEKSFTSILKTVMMCQALNINVKIDLFDSDTSAVERGGSYVICNVADSVEKLNLKRLLVGSHKEFFNCTLFNGYTAAGTPYGIGTYLSESTIKRDLSSMYDVIGGNMLPNSEIVGEDKGMVETIIKIGWK